MGTLLGCPDVGCLLWLERLADELRCGCVEGKAGIRLTPIFLLFLYQKASVQDSQKAATPVMLVFLPFVHFQSL